MTDYVLQAVITAARTAADNLERLRTDLYRNSLDRESIRKNIERALDEKQQYDNYITKDANE